MNRHGTSIRPLTLKGFARAAYRSHKDYSASEMRDNPTRDWHHNAHRRQKKGREWIGGFQTFMEGS
jgi:hypothetical protein